LGIATASDGHNALAMLVRRLLFLYRYVLRFGFLDGVLGLIYCGFQAVQMFHAKAKIYELNSKRTEEWCTRAEE
jgi:hypothetical protein